MTRVGITDLSIVIAALGSWLAGAVWYWLCGKAWEAALEPSDRPIIDRSAAPFIISFLANLIIAYVMATAIGYLGPGPLTVKTAVLSAAILWLGFVATTMTVSNAFAGRKPSLTALEAGHWLLAMVVAGIIIAALAT
jgi:hypothetical protein